MPTLKAKLKKGIPVCPECSNHNNDTKDYGIVEGKGKADYWFSFKCEKCSDKKRKVFVKYQTDSDFKVIRS